MAVQSLLLHPFFKNTAAFPAGEGCWRLSKSFAEFAARYGGEQFGSFFCRVGALRKHAGGMFLVSDLGGYAAVASVLIFAALQ